MTTTTRTWLLAVAIGMVAVGSARSARAQPSDAGTGTGWGDLQPSTTADAGVPTVTPESEPETTVRPETPVSREETTGGEATSAEPTMQGGGAPSGEGSADGDGEADGEGEGGESDDSDDSEDSDDSLWPDNLQVAGFVDAYTMLHLQALGEDRARLRAFDVRTSEIALSYAELAVWMAPEPLGFRIDLGFGPTAAIVSSLDPINDGPETSRTVVPTLVQLVQQVYGSAHFDVGGGLTLDVGKFVTPFGQEVIEARDNWAYSRSLLFTLAIPFYHFGLRANYVFGDAFNVTLLAVNGWDNVADNNDGKSFGLSLAIRPIESLQIYANYMIGPEQSDRRVAEDSEDDGDEDGDLRHMMDLVVLFTPIPMLQLGINVDLGLESGLPCSGSVTTCAETEQEGDAMWMGGALSVRVNPLDWLSIAARGEWFRDADGFRTGAEQSLFEGTLTVEARYATNMIVRLEYRHDQSTEAVFSSGEVVEDGTEPEDSLEEGQDTISLAAIIGF